MTQEKFSAGVQCTLLALSLIGTATFSWASGSTAGTPSTDASTQPIVRELMLSPKARQDALETTVEVFVFGKEARHQNNNTIEMTGLKPKWSFSIEIPRDELATKATVALKWTPSPALIPMRSQLNVRLNGEMQHSIPIREENLGHANVTTFELNPKKFKDVNDLEFQFVGSYTHLCETPAHGSLWLDIDKDSSVTLEKQKIRVADELQLLPSPFIDPAATKKVTLPMVFAGRPSDGVLQAAGVTASWAGRIADWRGLSIPVYYGRVPADTHFITFVTPEQQPEFIDDLPEITGPELLVVDSPYSSWAKALIVAGRNEQELLTAAQALALHSDTLSGARAVITEPVRVPQRAAYDAEKWIPTDRKVLFEELLDYRNQLRSSGALPAPIRLTFRLPPDLFILPRTNVPLDLRYRYTPPPKDAPASLRIRINDSLMDIHELEPDSSGNEANVHRIAALDSMASWLRALNIPAVYLDAANTLEFDFQYSLAVSGGVTPDKCPSLLIPDNQVEVVPNSTLDFRGFYHYAEMPNLRLFTQAGYPFSRFADLSQTVFVLPREPGASDVATFLTTVARIGRQTGTAGLLLSVTTAPEPEALADRDLLLIGRLPEAYDLETYDAFLGDTILEHLAPTDADAPRHLRQVAVRADLLTSDRRAVLLGFESPLKEGRSVVALLSAPGEGTHILQEKLSTLGSFYDVDGSLSVVAGPSSVNFRSVDTYWIGDLPWHQRLWYALLDRPLVLFGLSILFLGVTAVLLYLLMTRVVARRLLAARDALRIPSNRKS